MNARFLRCVLALLFCAGVSAQALAQSPGTVRGTVTDASGGVVPNVTIVVSNTATRAAKTTTTGAAGAYVVSGL